MLGEAVAALSAVGGGELAVVDARLGVCVKRVWGAKLLTGWFREERSSCFSLSVDSKCKKINEW